MHGVNCHANYLDVAHSFRSFAFSFAKNTHEEIMRAPMRFTF